MTNGVMAGIFIEQEGLSFEHIRELASMAESEGLHSVWLQDHFFFTGRPLLECFTTLSALARVTEEVRLGTLVICNSYRNPGLVARMASTIDRLSEGRLCLGMGAGWHREEYEAYGYEFPPAGTRVGQLEEALQVILSLWTEERTSFRGRFYTFRDAICEPKPLQKPHPPLWVGGGKPRILSMAARLADGVNFLSPAETPFTPEECARRIALLRPEVAGREGFTFSIPGLAVLSRDREEVRRGIKNLMGKYAARRALLEGLRLALKRPGVALSYLKFLLGLSYPSFLFAGGPAELIDQLRPYIDAGADYLILDLHSSGLGPGAIRLFARDVLPALG
ncbi:MAG: LLM class flavin-dependent oxidoreductase [Thermoplasmata archaeon]